MVPRTVLDPDILSELMTLGPDEAIIGGRIYGDLERLGQPIGRADPMIAGIAIFPRPRTRNR